MKLRHYVWQPRSNKAPATRWPMRFWKKAGDDKLPQVNGFRTLRGLGVSGEAEGHQLLLGNRALLNEQLVATDDMTAEITAQASQRLDSGPAGD